MVPEIVMENPRPLNRGAIYGRFFFLTQAREEREKDVRRRISIGSSLAAVAT
jgi:hypothetical protein